MKIIYYNVAVILTALNVVQSKKGCPYGWYLSADETTCYVNCFSSQLYFSNVYCNFFALKRANVSYDSSTNILKMPSGDSMGKSKTSLIPPCYNVTLRNDQYDVTSDGFIRIAPYLMEISLKSVMKITLSNVTLCYPSSPQLLQCDTLRALSGSYEIVNGTMLSIFEKNITAFLGDFYVNNEAIAFFCAQSSPNVSFTKLPRCNMAVLQHTDYDVNKEGFLTVFKTNVTIKNPLYSINYSQHAIACFPLSFNFLNCPLKLNVAEYYYEMYPNQNLLDQIYRGLVDPFDYYITLDAQLTICVNGDDLLSAPVIIQTVYNCFDLLSGFALIFTVVLRFKLFVQSYHNLCLLCHLVSLIIMYLCMATHLFSLKVNPVSCYVLFSIYYFCNMAVFFWLNVAAYESWRFFSRIQTVRQCCAIQCDNTVCPEVPCIFLPENNAVRFAVYNVYCWGLAAILTAIVLFLDLYVSPYDFSYDIRPYIYPNCFFTNTNSFIMFITFPLMVAAVINLTFLGLTIRILHLASAGTEMANVRGRKKIFRICMKLILLMGLSISIDSICYFLGPYDKSVFQMWFLATGQACVQGIVISVIYCAQTLRSMCK